MYQKSEQNAMHHGQILEDSCDQDNLPAMRMFQLSISKPTGEAHLGPAIKLAEKWDRVLRFLHDTHHFKPMEEMFFQESLQMPDN